MGRTEFDTTSSGTVLCSSSKPADLRTSTTSPEVVCAGFTHEEAKRHAGLTGIEMYVSQLIDSHVKEFKNQNDHIDSRIPEGFMGIGAGETIEEAVCRGLKDI